MSGPKRQLSMLLPLKGGRVEPKEPVFKGRNLKELREEVFKDLELTGLRMPDKMYK